MVAIYEKRGQDTSSDLINFMLQMGSKFDRDEYLDLQKSQLALSKKQFGISQAQEKRAAKLFTIGKPLRKGAAVEAKGRKRLVKRYARADQALETAKREYAVAKTTGDVARQADAARKLSVVKALHGKSAEMFETILFADEIAKDSRAQLYQAQQQVATANQETALIERQFKYDMQRIGSQYDAVASTITPENLPAGIAAMNAIQSGDMEMFGKMHASMRATATKKAMQPEERRFTASKLNAEVVAEFGPGTYQQMLTAEAANLPYPDVRSVYKDVQWPRSNWRKILTREEARTKGAEDEWMKSSRIDLERMGDRTQPKSSDKDKTVKELASERVKKTTPAKSKAAKKPAVKKTIGGYTVGQVINRAGKRYKVTGFDADGEPLVVEVK